MSIPVAARICCIRACIDALLVRACESPETTNTPNECDQQLMNIVRVLSRQNIWRHELESLASSSG
jgi:hypothetical protein